MQKKDINNIINNRGPHLLKLKTMDKTLNNYLKSHKGTASRLQTIFDYHYDQILREIKQTIPAKDQPQVMDSILDYMEEVIAFPSNDSLDNFIEDLSK